MTTPPPSMPAGYSLRSSSMVIDSLAPLPSSSRSSASSLTSSTSSASLASAASSVSSASPSPVVHHHVTPCQSPRQLKIKADDQTAYPPVSTNTTNTTNTQATNTDTAADITTTNITCHASGSPQYSALPFASELSNCSRRRHVMSGRLRYRPASQDAEGHDQEQAAGSLEDQARHRKRRRTTSLLNSIGPDAGPVRCSVSPANLTRPSSRSVLDQTPTRPIPEIIDLTQETSPILSHTAREVETAHALESLRHARLLQSQQWTTDEERIYLGASRDLPILIDDSSDHDTPLIHKTEEEEQLKLAGKKEKMADSAVPEEPVVVDKTRRDEIRHTHFASINCVICMDSPTKMTMTPCGHVFCHSCLSEAYKHDAAQQRSSGLLRSGDRCPMCRKVNKSKKDNLVHLLLMKRQPSRPVPVVTSKSAESNL